ncbi:chloride channel protein [Paraburkholderia terrae]|uniref:chloride channel protein n=1 Tax=Paraburkholderia terrae TaxID=311230 RepID=UPI001E4DC0B0|nr:chloride channel protein [Paraburkholderia terrae]
MPILSFVSRRTSQRIHRLWLHYGVFWIGAVAVGLVAVLYAKLIDVGYEAFLRYVTLYWWLPLLISPVVAATAVWLTRRFFPGSEGSGIPQVIATLHGDRQIGEQLLTWRILVGKILVSFLSILGGFTIGREGPTIHVGAAILYNFRSFYPARFRSIRGAALERRLALAGAAAGLSAAFNAPLAGVVFAIEELTRSFEQRTSGVLITAIIFAGVVALGLVGNYTYFGTINVVGGTPRLIVPAVVVIGVLAGIAGGTFCWILLNTHRWMPAPVLRWRSRSPVMFGAACGLLIAIIGVCSHAHTFGSGYAEARGMLSGEAQVSPVYPLLKMVSMVGSYLPGAPGGMFAPSLAIGAGIGNTVHMLLPDTQLPMLIALGMVGYLAAVTQSPITAFVIVIEMINGHALVLSLMATALIASQVSRFFAPPLYEALSERYAQADSPDRRIPAVMPGESVKRGQDAAIH